jgi:two-component system NarL family sensor kinase
LSDTTDPQRLLTRMLVSAINAREQESDRVSRTLHDEVGQVLSAVGLQLDALKLEFQERVPEIVSATNNIQTMLEQAMSEVRALSYDLNPAVVERVGLQYALDRLIGRFRNRYKGSLRFLFDSSVRVPLGIANAWYKITEHALENAIQHANSSKIEVHVRPTGKAMILEIRDNGAGFSIADAKQKSPGLGLLLMEHYASQADLELQALSDAEHGTVIRCSYTPESGRRSKSSDKKEKQKDAGAK